MRKMPEIQVSEVLHYLGVKQGDERILKEVKEQCKQVQRLAKWRVIYREFPLFEKQTSVIALPGEDIQRLFKESHACIFMAATLGVEVERELHRLEITDMGKALVFDAAANAMIEAVCDVFCKELEEDYGKKNCFLTDRFSCGYGDLTITIQKEFIQVLDAQKKIGLHVNDSNTMMPRKSVTAIMGISNTVQPAIVRGCGVCALRNTCVYRRGGSTCGKKQN